MIKRLIHISLLFGVCIGVPVEAQQLVTLADTDSYTDYLISNPEEGVYPAYEFNAPFINGSAGYQILDQDVVQRSLKIGADKKIALDISDTDKNLIETRFKGLYRGKEIVSLKVNLVRASDNSTQITKKIKLRIFKDNRGVSANQLNRSKSNFYDHPLSSGGWYKIPITKNGIYQLTSSYLSELGIDIESVDPRKIQIWGTDGYMLPEQNNLPRPDFSQLPILVNGENDGSFDANDRVIFYGTSPHREFRGTSGLEHQLHSYSDSTYVFLTIGSSNGDRLNAVNNGLTPTSTITTFEDYIWKEEELTKTETQQKTGRLWLGQSIPSTAQNQFISVFRDTIPGVSGNTTLKASGIIYARTKRRTNFEVRLNESTVSQFNIDAITYAYNGHEGVSARRSVFRNVPVTTSVNNGIFEYTLKMSNGDNGATGFVDYLALTIDRPLIANNNQLLIFPYEGGTSSDIATYKLQGFGSAPTALDVTDPMQPMLLNVSGSGTSYDLVYHTNESSKIFVQSGYLTPVMGRSIPNQNLHSINTYPEYIVITSEYLLDQAQELASYRSQQGLNTILVTQNQILNEFSGGVTDPTAIRDFVKFLWDNALADGQTPPENLLLFGDTTYDTKKVIEASFTNHVLTYESEESIDRIKSYGTDDYFGLLDDGEGLFRNSERVDIGIGRIPAQTRAEASVAIDKIYRYENPANYGDWQNLFTFAGDDDFPDRTRNKDLHVLNADGTATRMDLNEPGARLKKIYLFAYQEEITGAGRQLPGATRDFMNAFNNGSLVVNYSGHGNEQNLTDEEMFSTDYLPDLTNQDRLALLVTATCQFGRYDDINAQSGAEKLVFADNGGAIASFTTTRVVYTGESPNSSNFGLNINLSQKMLERETDGSPLTFGEIYKRTKNTSSGAELNSRKFILLGDPAVRFALPNRKASIQSINNVGVSTIDTLTIKALDTVTLTGSVTAQDGTPLPDFSGEATITIFDAKRRITLPQDLPWIDTYGCLLNENTEFECTYEVESDVLFKGKAAVQNGHFSSTFIIPKDISFSDQTGRIVVFAKSDQQTAGGSYTDVIFNGVNSTAVNDGKGPGMDVYLNDETFINGSLSTDSPKLIVELSDSSGINTTGTGVGHEIIATIDTKPQQTYVLNNFYEGALNDYTKGRIEYPLEQIQQGSYSLKVRAWDVHNNPAEKTIFFDVASQEDLVLDNIYNYPNPMNNYTNFTFEHNQQGNPMDVDIRIYTLSGKPVQLIKESILNNSSYASISWNGRDRDNDRLGNGTYIYVLRVTTDTPEGRTSTEKIEKLVIIR